MTATTGANGEYSFTLIPPESYSVTIASYEFEQGGTLYNWVASPPKVGDPATDSDGDAAGVTMLPGETNKTLDFGFHIPSNYTITKQLNAPNPIRRQETISFTIRITNTGATTIQVLPLTDVYSTTYLLYGAKFQYSHPPSDDTNNDGQIDWSDLTVSFGQDLAPSASFSVIATFTAKADTTLLPDSATINTAIVHDALADMDGDGPLTAQVALSDTEAIADVQIVQPTGIDVAELSAAAQENGIRLSWETASEANILGFNILRAMESASSEWAAINPALIFANRSGSNEGGSYTILDADVRPGRTYMYRLEVVGLNGKPELYGSVQVALPPGRRLYTPLILRR